MALIEAAAKTQAKTFHQPAKNPTARPYFFPGVTEAHRYGPAEEGIADASSASDAAIMQ